MSPMVIRCPHHPHKHVPSPYSTMLISSHVPTASAAPAVHITYPLAYIDLGEQEEVRSGGKLTAKV